MRILLVTNKKDEAFLRHAVAEFDFNKYTQKEIEALIKEMRQTMRIADGVGLAATQIGLEGRVFIAEPTRAKGKGKFYAVFNPKLKTTSEETVFDVEGCLSIPGKIGEVERFKKITVTGQDKRGKPITLKVFGQTARIFQHEIDHLNGVLFTDRAKKITLAEGDDMRRG